ncbi:hypothetical protein O7632_11175 [Solwaraspora sp. WMMD406]|uniref:hypothetical protein n=1 Tax=Solwaraspora sp. WMMD406 TaxID=3016095 RepID=UPI0024163ACC|nr:hypothetical protein [Solwaraspora sp. WMMD406]MDG4764659.1 hypothetical protein [Solwaraspora sp. WMMD406]
MRYIEVEKKYRLADAEVLRARLTELGANPPSPPDRSTPTTTPRTATFSLRR